jgi:hypothetical protein
LVADSSMTPESSTNPSSSTMRRQSDCALVAGRGEVNGAPAADGHDEGREQDAPGRGRLARVL